MQTASDLGHSLCWNFSFSGNETGLPQTEAPEAIRARGAASRKRAPYFTLANKQKSQTLKNSLSLLNLYD